MAQLPATGWGACDSWQPPHPIIVDEAYTANIMKEGGYYYAELWGLADNLVADPWWKSPVGNNGFLAASQDGTVYMSIWGADAGIVLIDYEAPEVIPLFSVPSQLGTSCDIGGPDDTAFVNIAADVWQIHPGRIANGLGIIPVGICCGVYIGWTHAGHLSRRDNPVRALRNGSKKMIADGFHTIYDVCVTQDDIIFVYELDTGDIVPIGSRRYKNNSCTQYHAR